MKYRHNSQHLPKEQISLGIKCNSNYVSEDRHEQVMYHVGRPGEDGYTTRMLAAWLELGPSIGERQRLSIVAPMLAQVAPQAAMLASTDVDPLAESDDGEEHGVRDGVLEAEERDDDPVEDEAADGEPSAVASRS